MSQNLGIQAFITDDAQGLTSEHITYSDLDIAKLNSIPESKLHRNVDKAIIEADKSGYVKSYIIVPGRLFYFAVVRYPLIEGV